jgi:hypothetical protein
MYNSQNMEPYFIILFLLCIAAAIFDLDIKSNKSIRDISFIALGVLLVLFAVFRIDTGYDYPSYKTIFLEIKNSNIIQYLKSNPWSIEPAYIILNYLFRFAPYVAFLGIITTFSITSKLIFIYRYSSKPFISLVIYFASAYIIYDFGIIRQGFALAIGIWSYKYFQDKQYIKAVIIIAIASLFHFSSLILLLILLISDKRLKLYQYVLLIFIGLLGSVVPLVDWISKGLNLVGLSGYGLRIQYYALGTLINVEQIYLSVAKRSLIWLLGAIFVNINIGKAKQQYQQENHIFFYSNIYFISIVGSLFFAQIPNIASRGIYCLIMSNIFLYPMYVQTFQNKSRREIGYIIMELILFGLIILDSITDLIPIVSQSRFIYHSWF